MDSKLCLFFLALIGVASSTKLPLKNGHVYHTVKLADFGKLNITFAFKHKNGLEKIDDQHILDMHNILRAKLAIGMELGWNGNNASPGATKMPPASNMMTAEWDDRLAAYAQSWANTCKDGHSPIKPDSIKGYEKFSLGENLSGDITFLERDMYGEVHWWNFNLFGCQKGKQCGHYLNFAGWGMSRVGCGWKVCPRASDTKTTLVCLYAGVKNTAIEDGKTRTPWQHEYVKGPPCSRCEQGWDFCMGGGLCATKKQCDSTKINNCVCLNKKDKCEAAKGIFDAEQCTCKCPKDKKGINCAESCSNRFPDKCGMDCSDEADQHLFCEKTCGGCGNTISSAYKFWFKAHPKQDSKNLKVRAFFEDPDPLAEKVNVKTLPDHNKCKNKGTDLTCNILLLRGYCKDALFGKSVKMYCPLSCTACDEAKRIKEAADKDSAKYGFGDLSKFGNFDNIKIAGNKKLSTAEVGQFKDIAGLDGIDLSGFTIVR